MTYKACPRHQGLGLSRFPPLFDLSSIEMRRFRYLDLLTIGFVVVLLISNLVGPKICRLGPLRPSAAEFLFPLTYICGDVFT